MIEKTGTSSSTDGMGSLILTGGDSGSTGRSFGKKYDWIKKPPVRSTATKTVANIILGSKVFCELSSIIVRDHNLLEKMNYNVPASLLPETNL
jgi:hypothetical protein